MSYGKSYDDKISSEAIELLLHALQVVNVFSYFVWVMSF